MAIDLESLGYQTDPSDYTYTWRDAVFYALSVGAMPTRELDFLYEGRGPLVLPTFATVPTFSVFDLLVDRIGCDRQGMVHESQRMRFLKPMQSSASVKVVGRVAGLYDLKRMAIARLVMEAWDEDGELVTEAEVSLLLRNDGGFGGPRPGRSERVSIPEGPPDFEVEDRTGLAQAAIYRLNGDLNPLHLDPDFARNVGFDEPILHGMCTFGYAGRAVLHQACGGDPRRLRYLQGQFRSPVLPGDTVVTRGWQTGDRVLLKVATKARPEDACLTSAYAEIAT